VLVTITGEGSAHLARFGQIQRGYRKGENVRQLLLRSKT
jgi:hypothetical protein